MKTLILENCDIYYPLNDLPASLIRLEIFVLEFSRELDNLPPNLKVLRIDTGGIGAYCSGYPHPLNNLPSGLEILYSPETIAMDSQDYPANFDNLPSLLKYLYLPPYLAASTNFDAIPESVEVIEFHNYPKFIEKINKYPTSLKKIFTNCNVYKNYDPFDEDIELIDEDIELIKTCLIKKQYFGKFDFYLKKAFLDTKEYKLIFEISQ